MDLSKLAREIEEQLNRIDECEVSVLAEASDEGGAYAFTMEETAGFVSCEGNAEDIGVPTVTVAVFVSELAGAESDDLVNLLILNGLFLDTNLVAHETDEEVFDLFAQRRIPAEAFEGVELADVIGDILEQLNIVMGESDEE